MPLFLSTPNSPLGKLLVVTDEQQRVCALDFTGYEERLHRLLNIHFGHSNLQTEQAALTVHDRLASYFDGHFSALDTLEVYRYGKPFQREVWAALRRIPAGEIKSYGQLAHELGRPNAARAVGWANANNPIAIIVPCHRVVGQKGDLRGFAGGLQRKQWLLAHEKARLFHDHEQRLEGF